MYHVNNISKCILYHNLFLDAVSDLLTIVSKWANVILDVVCVNVVCFKQFNIEGYLFNI